MTWRCCASYACRSRRSPRRYDHLVRPLRRGVGRGDARGMCRRQETGTAALLPAMPAPDEGPGAARRLDRDLRRARRAQRCIPVGLAICGEHGDPSTATRAAHPDRHGGARRRHARAGPAAAGNAAGTQQRTTPRRATPLARNSGQRRDGQRQRHATAGNAAGTQQRATPLPRYGGLPPLSRATAVPTPVSPAARLLSSASSWLSCSSSAPPAINRVSSSRLISDLA